MWLGLANSPMKLEWNCLPALEHRKVDSFLQTWPAKMWWFFIQSRPDSILCLQSITLCVHNNILDKMNFTRICQCFADVCTLVQVQLQEAKGLNKFYVTSKARTANALAVLSSSSPSFSLSLHIQSFPPTYKYSIWHCHSGRVEGIFASSQEKFKSIYHIYKNQFIYGRYLLI